MSRTLCALIVVVCLVLMALGIMKDIPVGAGGLAVALYWGNKFSPTTPFAGLEGKDGVVNGS
jgi:hypothetical protein